MKTESLLYINFFESLLKGDDIYEVVTVILKHFLSLIKAESVFWLTRDQEVTCLKYELQVIKKNAEVNIKELKGMGLKQDEKEVVRLFESLEKKRQSTVLEDEVHNKVMLFLNSNHLIERYDPRFLVVYIKTIGYFLFCVKANKLKEETIDESMEIADIINRTHDTYLRASCGLRQPNDYHILTHDEIKQVEQSVVFVDIRGFTTLTEILLNKSGQDSLNRSDYKSIEIVRAFCKKADEIIRNYNEEAVIEKFLGDGFMATFRVPLDVDEESLQDCRKKICRRTICFTLRLQEEFKKMKVEWEENWIKEFMTLHNELISLSLGIGIDFGHAYSGYFGLGSWGRFDIIGDTVNMAQRLESVAGKLNEKIFPLTESEIIISQRMFYLVKETLKDGDYIPRILDLKGKGYKYPVYSLTKGNYENIRNIFNASECKKKKTCGGSCLL
jgi:class 3 adenylate cyclase